jgi:hypothetical protein
MSLSTEILASRRTRQWLTGCALDVYADTYVSRLSDLGYLAETMRLYRCISALLRHLRFGVGRKGSNSHRLTRDWVANGFSRSTCRRASALYVVGVRRFLLRLV